MQEHFSCQICFTPYDDKDRLPRIIPCGNGHTICSTCIQGLLNTQEFFRCPIDRVLIPLVERKITEFAQNLELKGLIELFQATEYCKEHSFKVIDLICLQCKVKICTLCEKQKHRNHDTEILDEVVKSARKQNKTLEQWIQDHQSPDTKHTSLINNKGGYNTSKEYGHDEALQALYLEDYMRKRQHEEQRMETDFVDVPADYHQSQLSYKENIYLGMTNEVREGLRLEIYNFNQECDEIQLEEYLKSKGIHLSSFKFDYDYKRGITFNGIVSVVADIKNAEKLVKLNGTSVFGKKIGIRYKV